MSRRVRRVRRTAYSGKTACRRNAGERFQFEWGAHPDQLLAVQQSIENTPGRASGTTLSRAAADVLKTILNNPEYREIAYSTGFAGWP
jgi:hypothetical protein